MTSIPRLAYPATVRHDLVDLNFDQTQQDSSRSSQVSSSPVPASTPSSSLSSPQHLGKQQHSDSPSHRPTNDDSENFDTVCLLDHTHHHRRDDECSEVGDDRDEDVVVVSRKSSSAWSQLSSLGTILAHPQFKTDFQHEYRLWSKSQKKSSKVQSTSSRPGKYSHNLSLHSSLLPKDKMAAKIFSPVDTTTTTTSSKDGSIGSRQSLGSTAGETQRLVDMSSLRRQHSRSGTDDEDDEEGELSSKGSLPSSAWSSYRGIFYSSLSSVFFSLSACIVKYLKDIHPGELAVARFFGILLLSIPMLVYHDLDPFGPRELRHLLVLRGLAGASSLYLRFHAFHYLPIADASVIVFSIPIFVSIFAWLFLKEPLGRFEVFTVSLAMLGLLMTTKLPLLFGSADTFAYAPTSLYYRPDSSLPWHNISSGAAASSGYQPEAMSPAEYRAHHLYGVTAALGSLLFASSVFIFLRKVRGAHHAVIMFNFGWVAIIETSLLTALLDGFTLPRTHFEWYLIVLLAVFSFFGQLLMTRALQLDLAGPVAIVRATTDIALAFIWQVVIFRQPPDLWSVMGALLVSSCIALISLRKWLNTVPEVQRPRWWNYCFH